MVRYIKLIQISADFLEIGCNAAGTHTLQNLIEIRTSQEESEILKSLVKANMLRLACNSNGTHIVQKIITLYEEDHREDFNDLLMKHLPKMCMNANSICVVFIILTFKVKKFISSLSKEDLKLAVIDTFEGNFIDIVEDAYGNYAVQYLLDNLGLPLTKKVVECVINNTVLLASQKFSSNVVEKCLGIDDRVSLKEL